MAIIFAGYNHGTDNTIVKGHLVVENGRLTGVDEEALMNRCNDISARLTSA